MREKPIVCGSDVHLMPELNMRCFYLEAREKTWNQCETGGATVRSGGDDA